MDVSELFPGLSVASRFYDDGPLHGIAVDCALALTDDATPQASTIEFLAGAVSVLLERGVPVVCVCDAGRNRSAVVAARVLMLQGLRAEEAIAVVRTARSHALDRTGGALTNRAFVAYLEGVGDNEGRNAITTR